MKGIRFMAGAFILLLIFACFISVPVFGENPWDADSNSDYGSETLVDTSGSQDDSIEQGEDAIGDPGQDLDWMTTVLFQLSFRFVTGFLVDSQPETVSPQVAAN
jgi:hypothetical protein